MKKYALLAFLIFNTLLHANNTHPEAKSTECRFDTTIALSVDTRADMIESELTTGAWKEVLNSNAEEYGVERVFNFKKIGWLEIVTTYADGHKETKNMIWRVAQKDNRPVLVLTDTSTDEADTYEIKLTCEGLSLTDQLLQKEINWIFQ